MKTSVFLDDELVGEVEKTTALLGEDQETVLRKAIRAGLPVLNARSHTSRPEGYFTDDYPLPGDRLELEEAMLKMPQAPDR